MSELPSGKVVYGFDPVSGEYTHMLSAALCPVTRSVYHYPADTTVIQPPDELEGYARVFTGAKWEYVVDDRGIELYDRDTGEMVGVKQYLGPIPDGLSRDPVTLLPDEPTARDLILQQILSLEEQQTPRRIREAALGVQESIDFLQDLDDQIAGLREQLQTEE